MPPPFFARIAICALLVGGCATETPLPQSSISLSESECLGSCPAYTMELYSDGRYVWNGRVHVSVVGIQRGRLNVEAYRQASRLISLARIDRFRDEYVNSACETVVSDFPTVVITVRDGSKVKSITHYRGCEGFPRRDELLRLEDELEKAMHIKYFVQ